MRSYDCRAFLRAFATSRLISTADWRASSGLHNRIVIAWLVASTSFTGLARGDVKVDRKPMVVERRTFDPAHPPADMPPLKGNEAAVTESKFDCRVAMKYELVGHKQSAGGCVTTLKVQHVEATLQLDVIIWLPTGATAKLTAHEEGHCRIAEQIYNGAEGIARNAGAALDGKTVTGQGGDCPAADKQATDSSARQFCQEYLKRTVEVTGQVGETYDELTAHGTRAKPAEDEAIRQAFQKVTGKAHAD